MTVSAPEEGKYFVAECVTCGSTTCLHGDRIYDYDDDWSRVLKAVQCCDHPKMGDSQVVYMKTDLTEETENSTNSRIRKVIDDIVRVNP